MLHRSEKGKSFWGPPVWEAMFIFAAGLRPENSGEFKAFLYSLPGLLPCDVCRKNLKYKLKNYPPEPYLTNKHDALFYVYMLKDLVNQHLTEVKGVVKKSPPFDEVKKYYFDGLGEECPDCKI